MKPQFYHLFCASLLFAAILNNPYSFAQKLTQNPIVEPENKLTCNEAYHDLAVERNRVQVYRERFYKPFLNIESILTTSNTSLEAASLLINGPYRQDLFNAEALFRFYSHAPWGGVLFQNKGEIVKRLEDVLGKANDAYNWVTLAKKMNLPLAAIDYLEKDALKFKNLLANQLLSDGWLNLNGNITVISQIIDEINNLKFPTQKEDSKFVEKQLQKEAEKILHAKLDMHNLQEGVHELRRKLRWIPILISAMQGRIRVIEDMGTIPDKLAPLQEVDESQKKYLIFKETELPLKRSVNVSQSSIIAFNYFIFHLGQLKEEGETRTVFRDALVKSGLYKNKKEADQWLIPFLQKEINWQEFYPRSKALYEQLIHSGLLQNFPS